MYGYPPDRLHAPDGLSRRQLLSSFAAITSGTVLVFVMDTVCGALEVLIGTLPKLIVGGVTLTVRRAVEPVSATVPLTAGAATRTSSTAERLELLFGVNITLMVQVA